MRFLVIAAVALCAACGGGNSNAPSSPSVVDRLCGDIPGCDAAREPVGGPTETIWRVEVVRTAQGGVRIGRIETLDVPEGTGVPLGATAGPHLLAALDGAGAPLDGQYLRVPDDTARRA